MPRQRCARLGEAQAPARRASAGSGLASASGRLRSGWLVLGFGLVSVGFRLDFGFGLIWLDSGLV